MPASLPQRLLAVVRAAAAWMEAHPAARFAGPALGLAMLAVLGWQMNAIGWDTLREVMPTSPWFYALFLFGYVSSTLFEVGIYRRLWGISWADSPMFFKKKVMNEALLGYSGEAYAVVWAGRRAPGRYSPIAAIKDNNIVSAIVGNASAFALLALTLLLADGERLATAAATLTGEAIVITLAIFAAVTLVLILKPKLMSLPAAELRWLAAIHAGRVVVTIGSTVLLWHLALPGVAAGLWLTLAAWRNVIFRLPFLPNKDLMFVNLAILALGAEGREVGALLAVIAALYLGMHLIVALITAAPSRRPPAPADAPPAPVPS